MEGSLTVIGPITLGKHLTQFVEREASDAKRALLNRIEHAEKVFYLVEPGVRRWFEEVLPDFGVGTESLDIFYPEGGQVSRETHLEVAEWVLQGPRLGLNTFAVFSGPWDICAPPASAAVTLALAAGIPVTMLPDVMFLAGPQPD